MAIGRRGFFGGALGFAVTGWPRFVAAADVTKPVLPVLPKWQKGEFQIHLIHTGVGESQFLIFPDGTTMLLDCPGNPAVNMGRDAVPILPNAKLHAGE